MTHAERRGVKAPSPDRHQRHRDLMRRDGTTWQPHPTLPDRGQWVPEGWIPDFDRGHPVYPLTRPA